MSIYRDRYNSAYMTSTTPWRILTVLRTVRGRTTSKLNDEALVISGLMHLTAGSAEKLSQLPPEDRLEEVIFAEYAVPHDVIFSNSRRRSKYGSRWIPISFLSQACPRSDPLPMSMLFAFPKKYPDKEKNLPKGLDIFAPAATIHVADDHTLSDDLPLPTTFNIEDYVCTVFEAGTDNLVPDIPVKNTALILPNDFGTSRAQNRFIAVVVTINAEPPTKKAWPSTAYNKQYRDQSWTVEHRALVSFDNTKVASDAQRLSLSPLIQEADLSSKYCMRLC